MGIDYVWHRKSYITRRENRFITRPGPVIVCGSGCGRRRLNYVIYDNVRSFFIAHRLATCVRVAVVLNY